MTTTDSQQALNSIIINEFIGRKSGLEKELRAQVNITTEFGREIPKQIGDYAQDKEIELLAQGNIEEAKKWAEGGVYRVALHTAMGALGSGSLEGALTTGAIASAAPHLNELQAKLKQKLSEQGLESSHITQQNQNGANIDGIQLNIQNTSDEFKGACYGCGGDNAMGGSIGDFKNLNPNIIIHIEHGSTNTSP